MPLSNYKCSTLMSEKKGQHVTPLQINGRQCWAPNCRSYNSPLSRQRGLSFHRFPDPVTSPELFHEWVRKFRRKEPPSSRAVLCSAHFKEDCLDRTGHRVRLRDHAVPTVFNKSVHKIHKKNLARSGKRQKNENEPKRPPCSYFLFLADFRAINKANFEGVPNGHKELIKAASEAWNNLPAADKEPYEQKAKQERLEYEQRKKEIEQASAPQEPSATPSECNVQQNSTIQEAETDNDETVMSKQREDAVKRRLKQGSSCWAINCSNRRNALMRQTGLSFHRFPNPVKSPDLYQEWLRNCCRTGEPGKQSVLCSAHFKPEWLDRTGVTGRLRENAVPTIFDLPDYLKKKQPKRRCTRNSNPSGQQIIPTSSPIQNMNSTTTKTLFSDRTQIQATDCQQSSPNKPECNVQRNAAVPSVGVNQGTFMQRIRPPGEAETADHSYSVSPSMRALKQKVMDTQLKLEQAKRQLKNMSERERRAKEKVRVVLNELKKKNRICAELQAKLKCYDDIPIDLLSKLAGDHNEDPKEVTVVLLMNTSKTDEKSQTTEADDNSHTPERDENWQTSRADDNSNTPEGDENWQTTRAHDSLHTLEADENSLPEEVNLPSPATIIREME